MYFVTFDCTGGITFDTDDHYEILNYLRDTYADLSNFDITEVKKI